MKTKRTLLLMLSFLWLAHLAYAGGWIRINQLGYLPHSSKVAVFMSDEVTELSSFSLINVFTGEKIGPFSLVRHTGSIGKMATTYRLNFSEFTQPGTYCIQAGSVQSPRFTIGAHVYNGTADFLLHYMRQQRCGYNPYLNDSCHVHDGYIVYHPTKTGQHLDVRGGWHDAGDYLQYTTTSANAIYQMLFAYQQNPQAFGDAYDANGRPGANGIPDIVDEIKWGLDWLNRMNPEPGELYNQIADDRDHASMRIPSQDPVDYGYGPGLGRPVYFCSGEPQERGRKTGGMNATTGVASTAGKFASDFALGAEVLKPFYPEFAAEIASKADAAYQQGIKQPGVCQTASVLSPYIYEEDNWTDDMELGAMELYRMTGEEKYLHQAMEYGRREPFTPWMGADSARHYQWYPFINMGHYRLASQTVNSRLAKEFIRNLRCGIERTYEKAVDSPFLYGIPSIWCSNNLTVAMMTQCRLYRQLTGDERFVEMESALLDWLFGCNPWGCSMIADLPAYGEFPDQPHSSYVMQCNDNATGGLVDGPVYRTIFEGLRGVNLEGMKNRPSQTYDHFQPDVMVYHDVIGDYATNEPTMDGTASLTYYLSAMQAEGMKQAGVNHRANEMVHGGIIRTDRSKKELTLIFSADGQADGTDRILATLKREGIQGAFFLTGRFFDQFPTEVQKIKAEGHYIGSHSDQHLLYMPWENRDSLLVTRQAFEEDLLQAYQKMAKAGIRPEEAPLFLPPYEYYNAQISAWTQGMGLQLINFTPGSGSNADYTTPEMGERYKSSKAILEQILREEKENGLNGHLMLIHLGTAEARTDKFYANALEQLIKRLKRKGYTFVPLREAVGI